MLLSVVIPVYNRQPFLPKLFASLEKQPYRPLEIILVDNFSADGSYEACVAFARERGAEGFSVIVERERKKGGCACRNKGLALAKGQYVFFFDSDDELSPDFFMDAAPFEPWDMICARTLMVFPDGRTKKRAAFCTSRPSDHMLSAMLSTQSFIVKKTFLRAAGGWDERLQRWNDWELGIRLLNGQPKLKWLRGKAYHRILQHRESISGKPVSADFPEIMKSLEAGKADVLRASLPQQERRRALRAWSAKCLLFAAQLFREGAAEQAQAALQQALPLAPSGFRGFLFRAFHRAACRGVPGCWRLFRLFL